ncbi:hypothetical protein KME70_17820 (plasmid) [Ralstonia solanacearum]|nr:hypothetical protein KME70_17820 [Ralstonia solanacearum]
MAGLPRPHGYLLKVPKHFEPLLPPLENADPRIPPLAGKDLPHRQREAIAAGRPAGLEIVGMEARFARQGHSNRPHGVAKEIEQRLLQYGVDIAGLHVIDHGVLNRIDLDILYSGVVGVMT